jgi:hypothetical protein
MNGGKVYYVLENLLNNNLIKIIQQYNITTHKRIYMDLLEDIIYYNVHQYNTSDCYNFNFMIYN